jgi:hypothetical protein
VDKVFYRDAVMDAPASVGAGMTYTTADASKGIFPVAFGSEYPVERRDERYGGWYLEILSHGRGDANLSFLNSGGPVLRDHKSEIQIGDVVRDSARICADLKSRADIKIYDPEIKRRLISGDKLGISVGYARTGIIKREAPDGAGLEKIWFAWKALEISVLVDNPPADPDVGFSRSLSQDSIRRAATIEGLLQFILEKHL